MVVESNSTYSVVAHGPLCSGRLYPFATAQCEKKNRRNWLLAACQNLSTDVDTFITYPL
jgi:hypothetical protein